MSEGADRNSQARIPDLITDPQEKAEREALNGLRQFDAGIKIIETHTDSNDVRPFKLRPSQILTLHREALDGISSYAGNFRPGPIEIGKSSHEPPNAHQVPELVEELCDYVNDNWETATAVHLAAYILWRLNWIHPFTDGNGRTSRITSFVVLCIKLGSRLPGERTVPAQIAENKNPYYEKLEAADSHDKAGVIDVSAMEEYLSELLAVQLTNAFEQATGRDLVNAKK